MITKLTISEMRKIATKRGGKCLSKKYINTDTKLKWECKMGHTWKNTPYHIKAGQWCPVCSSIAGAYKLRGNIEQMQELAFRRGGKCISKIYVNSRTKLGWECAEGHIWKMNPDSIMQGQWCPKCGLVARANKRRGTVEQMQEIAAKRGGRCLSKNYVSSIKLLTWQCTNGHTWKASPGNVKSGTWCPFCGFQFVMENVCREIFQTIFKKTFVKARPKWLVNKSGSTMEFDGYNKELGLAFEYHGEQHFTISRRFHEGGRKVLTKRQKDDAIKRFLCKQNNIKLIEIPYTVEAKYLYEYIVNQCNKFGIRLPPHKKMNTKNMELNYFSKNLMELKGLAEEHRGQLLSKTYLGAHRKLTWWCSNGHIWEAEPNTIKQGGWCGRCAGKVLLTIQEMQDLAKKHGGKCLSKKYINSHTKLKWQCKNRHRWEAIPISIKRGSWCPKCGIKQIWETRRSKSNK